MYRLTIEAKNYLDILQATDSEIKEIENGGNLSAIKANDIYQRCSDDERIIDLAADIINKMTETKVAKKLVPTIEMVLQANLDPVTFGYIDEDLNNSGLDTDTVAGILEDIFDTADNELRGLITKGNIFKVENKKSIDETLYPIIGIPSAFDVTTCSRTDFPTIQLPDDDKTGGSVFGCTLEYLSDPSYKNELDAQLDKSMLFLAPLNMKSGCILVSRAYTFGNTNRAENDKFDMLDLTAGDREKIKESVNHHFGVRHPIYSLLNKITTK